jgi:hypothetical protein
MDDGANGEDSSTVEVFTPLTTEQGFNAEELAMPLKRLHALCRQQVRWAESDGDALQRECRRWEDLYKREWLEKEVLLDQVVQGEIGWHERRRAVISGAADVKVRAKANGDATENGQGHMDVDQDTAVKVEA